MKKNIIMGAILGTALSLTSLSATEASLEASLKLDRKTVCSVQEQGINKVIATAEAYNNLAKKMGVEFRRLGINNTDLIISVKEALKNGKTKVRPNDFKKKKPGKTKLSLNDGAQRACLFGINAVRYAAEGKSNWRTSVPGDGFNWK